MSESQILSDCIKWLWNNGCYVWRNNSGKYKKGPHWIAYGLNGSADIVGMTKAGRFLAVETKIPGKTLDPAQELFKQRVEEKNGIYIMATCVEDLQASGYFD